MLQEISTSLRMGQPVVTNLGPGQDLPPKRARLEVGQIGLNLMVRDTSTSTTGLLGPINDGPGDASQDNASGSFEAHPAALDSQQQDHAMSVDTPASLGVTHPVVESFVRTITKLIVAAEASQSVPASRRRRTVPETLNLRRSKRIASSSTPAHSLHRAQSVLMRKLGLLEDRRLFRLKPGRLMLNFSSTPLPLSM